jgi:predicted naringenin-chalcone synthase
MATYIHSLSTAVPETAYRQDDIRRFMEQAIPLTDAKTVRYLRRIYAHSGIETRHSVVRDLSPGARDRFFVRNADGSYAGPATGERNDRFIRESKGLYVRLAREAIAGCPGLKPGDITHLVTVSCTGFFSPGPDVHIVRELGLPGSTQRYHLGFMGCYAALPALRMAAAFCRADPAARVLVVCVELCSLHLQLKNDPDSILAGALFADGGAAAVVSTAEPAPGRAAFEIHDFESALVPGTEGDMAWRIGDLGFDIVLSTYVPRIIDRNIELVIESLFRSRRLGLSDVGTWAIHPGGKAIVDKLEKSLGLDPAQVRPSREVLRKYGNMSSPTVLFVLDEILRAPSARGRETVCAMAFGPGLTVETALLEKRAPFPAPDVLRAQSARVRLGTVPGG